MLYTKSIENRQIRDSVNGIRISCPSDPTKFSACFGLAHCVIIDIRSVRRKLHFTSMYFPAFRGSVFVTNANSAILPSENSV